jgi:hypothetical protein
LTLTKDAAQCDFVSAGATIGGLSTLTAAGFDVTGDVGGGSPRLNVVAADGFHFVSCPVAGGHATCDVSAVANQAIVSIDIVFDTMGTVVLSNLSLTGAPTVVSTVRFGPFAGGSPDSGTCQNNWANDTFERTFTVTTFSDGSQTLRQDYTGGAFTTVEGKSPGACEGAGGDNGGTVVSGIPGEFSGFTSGTLNCGEAICAVPSPGTVNPECPAPNVTACFVSALFGSNAVFNVSRFKFNYAARCGFVLVERTWQNADESNGGNAGDIKSAPGTLSTVACPTVPTPVATPTPTPTPTPTVSPSGLPRTGPTTSPTSTAAVSHLAATGGGGVPWSGLVLLLGLGLLLALGGGVVVARTQFRRF